MCMSTFLSCQVIFDSRSRRPGWSIVGCHFCVLQYHILALILELVGWALQCCGKTRETRRGCREVDEAGLTPSWALSQKPGPPKLARSHVGDDFFPSRWSEPERSVELDGLITLRQQPASHHGCAKKSILRYIEYFDCNAQTRCSGNGTALSSASTV